MPKSEIERLLAKYPNPRDVRYAPQVEGRGSELREQFSGTYGALGGLLGTAPDEFERGSVLSDSDSARDAAVKAGAEYGYPVGMALNVAPLLSGVGGLAAKYGPAAVKNASVPSRLSKQAGVIKASGESKMLQGVYRGRAGEPVDDAESVFAANQRPMAEYYAARRAEETGKEPHVDMMLIDPFVGKQYALHPPTTKGAKQTEHPSRVRKLKLGDIEGETELYADGGFVRFDPSRVDQIVEQLRAEFA